MKGFLHSLHNYDVECSERTGLSCLEPVCLCWLRFGRYFSHHLAKSEVKSGIFARRAMADQAREDLCYQRRNLTCNIDKDRLFRISKIFNLAKLCYYYAPPGPHPKWLCYFVRYGHGKLDLRFVHGRAEKCI